MPSHPPTHTLAVQHTHTPILAMEIALDLNLELASPGIVDGEA